MPVVTNPELRQIGTAARSKWAKGKREPRIDYPLDTRYGPVIGWVHIASPVAVLHTMHVRKVGDNLMVTYLQVSKDGDTVRSMTRHAGVAELERWFAQYPDDRKLLLKAAA